MIAASEPQEFVPYGRQQLLHHPKAVKLSDHVESTLLNQFSQVAISNNRNCESWILRATENEGVECEEELYYKEKTAVWSIGPASVDSGTNRVLKSCYTSETPIQEALWCNFHRASPEFLPTFFSSTSHKPVPTVVDNAGQEYVTSLQFQVQKMWPMKYGLLLERRVTKPPPPLKRKSINMDLLKQSIEQSYLMKNSTSSLQLNFPIMDSLGSGSNDLPTLFSLSHPLDEICPITSKNDSLAYVSNPDLKILMTNESPSMCLCQDRKSGAYILYIIRRALSHEAEFCWRRETRQSRRNSYSGKLSGSGSSFNFETENRSLPPFLSARTRKSLGIASSAFPNMQSSPYPFETRTSSPVPSRPFANISPMFSPYSSSSHRKGDSLLNSPFTGTPSRFESRLMSEDVEYAEAKPLFAQICLHCIWTESVDSRDSNVEVSRSFLTTDLMGKKYLCYLVKSKLKLLQLDVKDDENVTVVGEPTVIQARDACHLEARNMMAVIGFDGGVELYSGNVHVAKILISGVSSSVVTSTYLSDTTAGPTFFFKPSPGSCPKLSSHPQSIQMDSPIFCDMPSQFSPGTGTPEFSSTLPTTRDGSVVGIRDNVKGRISLEYASSILFRLELPHFGNSPLVDACLTVLRRILPHDLALHVLIKWYCRRNAPGCYHVELEEEFVMFSNLLYSLVGYDMSEVKDNKSDRTSPVTQPKKQRTSELQSDEDWAVLIHSNHHQASSRSLTGLNLSGLQLRPRDYPLSPDISETPVVSSRGQHKNADIGGTPSIGERSKRLTSTAKKNAINLEAVDETPIFSKSSFGKNRMATGRFQKSLEKGETGSPSELPRFKTRTSLIRNKRAILFSYASKIFFSLHLLYEDLKLNTLYSSELTQLVAVLYRLAIDMGCERFVYHYWLDDPCLCPLVHVSTRRSDLDNFLQGPAPSIFRHLNDILLKKTNLIPYPFSKNVNGTSRNIIQIFGLMSYGEKKAEVIFKALLSPQLEDDDAFDVELKTDEPSNPYHRVVLLLTKLEITKETLNTFPAGVAFAIHEALYRCRDDPGSDWTKEAYRLAERHDLASLCRTASDKEVGPTNKLTLRRKSNVVPADSDMDEDGMEELKELDTVKLRWATDQRVIELRRMLQSAQPARVVIQQRPDVSDHEFVQEQERLLYAICARTMALPIARGMVTLGCAKPVITEKLPIPPLCLTGRVSPSDKVVDMSHIEVPSNMNVWPLFHNGVAAGLRISPNAPDIDSKWIIYNKPKVNNDEQIEHAGFLMALGLNGHLKELMDLTIFMYLVRSHEMTRVGLLLGVAVSKRGTMDVHAVKTISVHIEAMLPPTGIELDVDGIVEPASLIALGFLYQGTAHRHIAQVLLQEIGRPPGPEMENSVDRESYSLSAGLALGLVVFGRGNSLSGLADMTIPDTLHHFMIGGPKRPYTGSQREKYKVPSFLIFEGPLVNTHVTGPGATLALGMLYFNTGNKAVAEWLKVPGTQHLLETVLPDALLLRTLAKSLILWNEIEPSPEWVTKHVPSFVLPYCLTKPQPLEECPEVDYETMNQAYCNIVAGACMAIGLRFAGSADQDAFETLTFFAHKFTTLLGKSIAELCGRATIETCLNVITVSLGMVMAGTGNLEVMRLCRYLRSRVGPNNSVVTYGSHLATHMALGLLFLGGGTLTLSTSPDAIAALLCAFYPKWPICSSDNRYHLQALRHLYVLAVEPRLLLPRDIDTRTLCYAHVTYVYLDTSPYAGKTVRLLAPCLLPQLDLLKEVRIEDDRYWTIRFTSGKNWEDFKKILANNTFVDVKKRAGFLSYLDDPHGFRSLLAQTLTSDDTIPWGVRPPSIYQFSSNPVLENFLHFFFDMKQLDRAGEAERKTLSSVTDFTYFCLTKDKLSLLPYWLSLNKLMHVISTHPSASAMWQWKLVFSQSQRSDYHLIPTDVALSAKQNILSLFSSWEPGVLVQVRDYLTNKYESTELDEGRVTTYLVFHDLPYRIDLDFASILSGDITSAIEKCSSSCGTSEAIACLIPLLEL